MANKVIDGNDVIDGERVVLDNDGPLRLPSWLKQTQRKSKATKKLSQWLQKEVPNSICQEAKCPNRGECFSKGF